MSRVANSWRACSSQRAERSGAGLAAVLSGMRAILPQGRGGRDFVIPDTMNSIRFADVTEMDFGRNLTALALRMAVLLSFTTACFLAVGEILKLPSAERGQEMNFAAGLQSGPQPAQGHRGIH